MDRTPNYFSRVRKRGLLEKGSFQKSPFSRYSREFRDSTATLWKTKENPTIARDSREFRDFRDSRDFSSEKTPFVMTPFFLVPIFTAIAEKREENPEILTYLMRKRLTRLRIGDSECDSKVAAKVAVNTYRLACNSDLRL